MSTVVLGKEAACAIGQDVAKSNVKVGAGAKAVEFFKDAIGPMLMVGGILSVAILADKFYGDPKGIACLLGGLSEAALGFLHTICRQGKKGEIQRQSQNATASLTNQKCNSIS